MDVFPPMLCPATLPVWRCVVVELASPDLASHPLNPDDVLVDLEGRVLGRQDVVVLNLADGTTVRVKCSCSCAGSNSARARHERGLVSISTHLYVQGMRAVTRSVSTDLNSYDGNALLRLRFLLHGALGRGSALARGLAVRSILVAGPHGCGKTTLVHSVAAEEEATLHQLSALEVLSCGSEENRYAAGEGDRALRDLFSAATASPPAVVLVDDADVLFASDGSSGAAVDPALLLQWLALAQQQCEKDQPRRDASTLLGRGVVLVGVSSRPEALHPSFRRCFDEEIFVPVPTPSKRLAIWRAHLGAPGMPPCSESVHGAIVALNERCHGWTGGDVHSAVQQAAVAAVSRWRRRPDLNVEVELKLDVNDITAAVETHRPALLRGCGNAMPFTIIPPRSSDSGSGRTLGWSSVAGLESVKQALREMVIWPVTHRTELRKLGVSPPRGIILHGPPGTGKTLLARVVAAEARANFLSVHIGDVIRGEVGESERALASVFSMARRCAPCVIFFDEFQALFGQRDGGGQVSRQLVSQLIAETDTLAKLESDDARVKKMPRNSGSDAEESIPLPRVVLMAATNVLAAVDTALLRPGRFDRQLLVPPPDADARREILLSQMCSMGGQASAGGVALLDHLVSSSEGMTGADLVNVCQRAALLAITEAKRLSSCTLGEVLVRKEDWKRAIDESRGLRPMNT